MLTGNKDEYKKGGSSGAQNHRGNLQQLSSSVLDKYEVVEHKFLPDVDSDSWLLRHKKSGARIALLPAADENKVFFIGFRTPPTDSTGVAHIIEHTVLCGSRDFPVKDPFIELVKGSLNTFLNAMTYPDKTVYPVASCNDTDFKNLMHVYLDAVFYPNIYREQNIFRQEGWHYEFLPEASSQEQDSGAASDDGTAAAAADAAPDADEKMNININAPLTVNGVVYNEMKGALSSPDDVLGRGVYEALYPHTPYAVESGGDPACIPDLTYEAYLDFHRRYYHPSNSYIYLYGDLDINERLTWLDEAYLSAFDRIEIDSEIPAEPAFDRPVEASCKYSILQDEEEAGKSYLSWNTALLPDGENEKLNTAFKVLDYVLSDAEGAPVKKALREKGIGEEIYSLLELGIRQPSYAIIAKYTDPERKDEFVRTIEDTLRSLVKNGLDRRALLAGINYFEFRYREANFGSYPKGLVYGLEAMNTWLYDDRAPFIGLDINSVFAELREEIGTGYFEGLIQKYLLDNNHRAVVVMTPEKGLTEKKADGQRARLDTFAAGLTEAQRQQIAEDLVSLRRWQETPDSEKDLETIPVLTRADMKKTALPPVNEIRAVPVGAAGGGEEFRSEETLSGAAADRAGDAPSRSGRRIPVITHPIFTGGIDYLTFMFDITDLPQKFFPYLGVFKTLFGVLDTEHYDYADLDREINILTGGIGATMSTYAKVQNPSDYRMTFEVTCKVLHENLAEAFRLVREILLTTNWNSPDRVREVLEEERAGMRAELASSGHMTAVVRATSYYSETSAIMDSVSGVDGYRTLDAICRAIERKTEGTAKTAAEKEEISRNDGAVSSADSSAEAESAAGVSNMDELAQILQEMAEYIFREDHLMVDDTAADRELSALGKLAGSFAGELFPAPVHMFDKDAEKTAIREADLSKYGPRYSVTPVRRNEGFTTAGQVQYVCRAGNFLRRGYPYTGALRVLRVIMGYDYLWNRIRVKGGAYGCMSGYSRDGSTYIVSYRDPHLRQTIRTFEEAPAYIRSFEADERTMTKYIIGAVSSLDHPLTPSAYGKYSLTCYMTQTPPDLLQRERDQVLQCRPEDIRALGDYLEAALSDDCLCAVGSDEKIRANADIFMEVRKLY